ncbi:MAG TPA: SusD/RagB family nutrient-binding outer membrane lipoprotein [Gemmatimonadaceae bacterium]|nr:SusD/RagB family nutrient-binding outer membrane lipoprotein [Gemmatimonadaceae bacterium]
MNTHQRYASVAALVLLGALGCNSFLTGGDLSNDPNRPQDVSAQQLVVSTQAELWAEMASDPARIAAMWTQQLAGAQQQYRSIYTYGVSEATTNGFHQGLYLGGGLVDLRKLQALARDKGDSIMLGVGQVEEAALMGTGADIFGDIVYSNAFKDANPAPDKQMDIYAHLQDLLDSAIINLAATGPTNVGPATADVVYSGDPAKWTKFAYTLKARYYLHTAEVNGLPAYQAALAAAQNGITDPADNYQAVFSGKAGEQNFWYQFDIVQRPGYLAPDPFFVNLLESRNDPRLARYFNADQTDLSDALLAPNYNQPLVTANENLLIWAEAAYRTGDEATALQKLHEEEAIAGVPPSPSLSGNALLAEILTEKYISLFQTIEPWNDYKRTCWPNVVPVTTPAQVIPARLFYDAAERQTDTSLLPPDQQPARNQNDPANQSPDPQPGVPCFGQLGTAP